MRNVIALLLFIAALFNLTIFLPGEEAWPLQPFAVHATSWLGFGLADAPGGTLARVLAVVAALLLLAAALSLVAVLVPARLFRPLALAGALGTLALFLLFLNPNSLLPIVLSLIILYAILSRTWTIRSLSEDDH